MEHQGGEGAYTTSTGALAQARTGLELGIDFDLITQL